VTEGLLVYLPREDVTALAKELQAQPAIRWWLLDLASPGVLKMMQKQWQPRLGGARACSSLRRKGRDSSKRWDGGPWNFGCRPGGAA
jgi:O-methyltransferase involved in polyketide biosynthesis